MNNQHQPGKQPVLENQSSEAQFAQLLQVPLLAWSVTTLAIFLSMILVMMALRYGGRSPNSTRARKIKEHDPSVMCTRVVDPKDGSREMNPDYVPRQGKHENPCAFKPLSSSVCEALLEHERDRPEMLLLGEHEHSRAPYRWISVAQFMGRVRKVGSGLARLVGVQSGSETRVGLLAGNSVEWVVSHMGLLFHCNVAVPLYATLGEQAMQHIVRLTDMRVCMCDNEARARQLIAVLGKDPALLAQLLHLILLRPKSPEETDKLRTELPANLKVHTLAEVEEAGAEESVEFLLPRPDSTYVLNFTSGTTGIPKGVIVTCDMFHHVIRSILGSQSVFNWMDQEDVYFSFLPLAHVFEQCLMAACLFVGTRVGFFAGELQRLMEDIECLQPTMIAMVPRLLCRVHDAFRAKLARFHVSFLLDLAVQAKLRAIESRNCGGPVSDTIWDRLLFAPLQRKLGGRLRMVISGSAACPKDVLDFCRAAMGATVHVGYGASETAGPITITYTDDLDAMHVGVPIVGTRVKLADVPDMELFPSKQPLSPNQRGEICVRGPSCTPGYFRDTERTCELIDQDGWLHTGDVGEWDAQGRLCIVDRCKNMFKLVQGEYVAPDRVESVYLLSPLVSQAFLDGRADQSFAVGLIHPDVERLAKRLCLASFDARDQAQVDELCARSDANQLMLQEITTEAKKAGLASFEQAKKIHLISRPFTCEEGLLTATLKPVRAKIRQHHARLIEQLYA